MPFSFQATGTALPEGPYGPTVRTGVKTGADVIDLAGDDRRDGIRPQ